MRVSGVASAPRPDHPPGHCSPTRSIHSRDQLIFPYHQLQPKKHIKRLLWSANVTNMIKLRVSSLHPVKLNSYKHQFIFLFFIFKFLHDGGGKKSVSHLLRVRTIYFFPERLLHDQRASVPRMTLKGTRFLAYQVFSSSNGWNNTSVTGPGHWFLVSGTSCRLSRSHTCPAHSKQESNHPYPSSNKDSNTPLLQYIARRVQFSRPRAWEGLPECCVSSA